MSRNPLFSEGTLTGGNIHVQLAELVRSKLSSVQSNGEAAWQLVDIPQAEHYVYHSVGDRNLGSGENKGDADIWIYIEEDAYNTPGYYYPYVDYSPISHDGVYKDLAGIRAYGTFSTAINDADDLDWMCVVDEYCLWMCVMQTGTYRFLFFGMPHRNVVPELGGIGRLASDVTSTGDVTLALDRDLTGTLRPGQKLWIVNQTPDGEALESFDIDIVTLEAINGTSLDVSGVVHSFSAGSLVGFDPMIAMVLFENSTEAYMINSIAGKVYPSSGYARQIQVDSMGDSDFSPTPNGFYLASQISVRDGHYMDGMQVRGTLPYAIAAYGEDFVFGDTLAINKGATVEYWRDTWSRLYNRTDFKFFLGPWPTSEGTEYDGEMFLGREDNLWTHQSHLIAREFGGGGGDVVSILSVVSTSSTTWRVTFSVPVLDNAALRNIGNYEFSPALDVLSVTPEATTNPSYVDLETTEQKDAETYTLTIHLVEAAP